MRQCERREEWDGDRTGGRGADGRGIRRPGRLRVRRGGRPAPLRTAHRRGGRRRTGARLVERDEHRRGRRRRPRRGRRDRRPSGRRRAARRERGGARDLQALRAPGAPQVSGSGCGCSTPSSPGCRRMPIASASSTSPRTRAPVPSTSARGSSSSGSSPVRRGMRPSTWSGDSVAFVPADSCPLTRARWRRYAPNVRRARGRGVQVSSRTARAARSCLSATGPTFPIRALARVAATEWMC